MPLLRQSILLIHSLRLAWVAQQLRRSQPLAQVQQKMANLSFLPQAVPPEEAIRASARAVGVLAGRFGLLGSCLVRSLVLGALLSDQDGTTVHVGFRSDETAQDEFQGHAWVSFRGRVLPSPDAALADRGPFEEVITLPMKREIEAERVTTLRGIRSALASGHFTQKKLADGSGVLLDVDGMRVIRLNRTGMFLVEEIQKGAPARTDLVNSLTAYYFEVESEEAQRDVTSLLEDLGRHLS